MTTPDPNDIREQCNPYIMRLLLGVLIGIYAVVIAYRVPSLEPLRIPLTYLIPVILLYGVVLAVIVYRKGHGQLPVDWLLAGLILVFGGAAFDMIATVVFTPDLQLESNFIARGLLDSGHSLTFIYVYALVAQFLAQLLLFALWAVFLRHRTTLLTLVWETQPASRGAFFQVVMSGSVMSWRKFFFSFRKPPGYFQRIYYHCLWIMPLVVIVTGVSRWYLGFKWFGLIPRWPDNIVAVVLVIAGIATSLIWLDVEYRRGRKAHLPESET